MIELGKNQPLVATCARGLEDVLAGELCALGAEAVAPDRGSVLFSGDLRTVYEANLGLRTAMRVLVPLSLVKAGRRWLLSENILV